MIRESSTIYHLKLGRWIGVTEGRVHRKSKRTDVKTLKIFCMLGLNYEDEKFSERWKDS